MRHEATWLNQTRCQLSWHYWAQWTFAVEVRRKTVTSSSCSSSWLWLTKQDKIFASVGQLFVDASGVGRWLERWTVELYDWKCRDLFLRHRYTDYDFVWNEFREGSCVLVDVDWLIILRKRSTYHARWCDALTFKLCALTASPHTLPFNSLRNANIFNV